MSALVMLSNLLDASVLGTGTGFGLEHYFSQYRYIDITMDSLILLI